MSNQSKKESFIEAIICTGVGILLTALVLTLLFPFLGIYTNIVNITWITGLLAIVSVFKTYIVRRIFNKVELIKRKKRTKKINNGTKRKNNSQ